MHLAMEDKFVCYYCGTIYDKELGKCPLCGSTVRSSQDEAERPQPRRRLTEQERKNRRKKSRGKYSRNGSKVSARPIMIAALIFLILAVLALGWFIMDMLGWVPGFEDKVDRESVSVTNPDTSCTELTLSTQQITFKEIGETAALEVRVNLYCTETVYVNSLDGGIASVAMAADTREEDAYKTATFTVTAVAEGQTEIRITCGSMEAVCKVSCVAQTPVDSTGSTDGSEPDHSETESQPAQTNGAVDEDYLPEVNCDGSLTFTARGERVTLRVTNLPDGKSATWATGDESVVKVNPYGEVTAIGSGKTKLYVTVAGKTTEILVRCNFGDFVDEGAHLESGRSDVTVSVGESFKLYLYDSDGDRIEDVTYEISDSSVCKVEDGVVTATGYGTAEVTIVYYEQEYTCIVRVR